MKAKIYVHPEWGDVSIIFYEDYPDGRRAFAEHIDLLFKIHEPGTKIEPTLNLPSHLATDILQSLADQIREQGIRHKQDELNDGELRATKYHLEDLRKLLKLC